jgi:hypothetical protein
MPLVGHVRCPLPSSIVMDERESRRSRCSSVAGNVPFPATTPIPAPMAVGVRDPQAAGQADTFPAMTTDQQRVRRLRPMRDRGPAAGRGGRRVPRPARPRSLKPPLLHANARALARSARRRAAARSAQRTRTRKRRPRGVERDRPCDVEPARRDPALVRRLLSAPRLARGCDRGRARSAAENRSTGASSCAESRFSRLGGLHI